MAKFNKQEYDNSYCKEHYDRCIFNVPKGQKAVIEAHRKKRGYKSLNQYVNDLINADIKAHEEPENKKRDLPDPGIRVAKL